MSMRNLLLLLLLLLLHLWKICPLYLNFIARTPEEMLERWRIVLGRLREVGLKVKPSKCILFKRAIEFLGNLVSVQGIDPVPGKFKAVRDWPTRHCLLEERAFFGLVCCYRRFVRNFASIAGPLTRLTMKKKQTLNGRSLFVPCEISPSRFRN